MVEFTSSICQVWHTDIGQLEDQLEPLSHLSQTLILEQILILPFVNELSPIWQSTMCLCYMTFELRGLVQLGSATGLHK